MRPVWAVLCGWFFSFFCGVFAEAQNLPTCVQSVNPAENAAVIGKKPTIEVRLSCSLKPETLLVTLDGIDVTPLLQRSSAGFQLSPPMILSAGMHTLIVTFQDAQGIAQQKAIPFAVRHTEQFQEAYVKSDVSVTYEGALVKPESASVTTTTSTTTPSGTTTQTSTTSLVPSSKLEGNLKTEMKLKEAPWEVSLGGNVRYFDQDVPAQSPLNKGFSIPNWILTTQYAKDMAKLKLSMGDISVTETPYTITGMSRKGTMLNAEYDIVTLNAFILQSRQRYSADGGIGIGDVKDDHVAGLSAGVKLFNKKMELRAIYLTGDDPSMNSADPSANQQPVVPPQNPPSPFGTTTTMGHKRGDVLSVLWTSNFFNNRMKTEFETAFSRLDPDISDEFGRDSGRAHRLKVDGMLGRYTYLASYEWISPLFGTIGNQGAEKDKQKIGLTQGLMLDQHMFNVSLLRANDNVDNSDLFARTTNYNGMFTYMYSGIKNLPIGMNYVKDLQKSSHEPANFLPVNRDTDMLSGSVTYIYDKFSIGFMPAFSWMNDKTSANADSKSITLSLTPSYNDLTFGAGAGISWNRTHIMPTGVWTDTYTISANIRKDIIAQKLVFDTADIFSITKADDGSVNSKSLTCAASLTYRLKYLFKDRLDPSIALRTSYQRNWDRMNPANDNDIFMMFLVVTTSVPFVF